MRKKLLITLGTQMTAFEQDVSPGERSWPEVSDLEASNYAGWVALFDAELTPVALVPSDTAATVCEVLNRFEHDTPVDYDAENNPIWESPPDPKCPEAESWRHWDTASEMAEAVRRYVRMGESMDDNALAEVFQAVLKEKFPFQGAQGSVLYSSTNAEVSHGDRERQPDTHSTHKQP